MSSTVSTVGFEDECAKETTAIGVDVGEHPLFAVSEATADPDAAMTISGEGVRTALGQFVETVQHLRSLYGETASAEAAHVAVTWKRLRSMIDDAISCVLDYARQRPSPTLVLEALGHRTRPLWEFRDAAITDRGAWVLPVAQERLQAAAAAAEIPVKHVSPHGTTRECHVCGEWGELSDVNTKVLRCTTPTCPVDTADRDQSAAITIARRA